MESHKHADTVKRPQIGTDVTRVVRSGADRDQRHRAGHRLAVGADWEHRDGRAGARRGEQLGAICLQLHGRTWQRSTHRRRCPRRWRTRAHHAGKPFPHLRLSFSSDDLGRRARRASCVRPKSLPAQRARGMLCPSRSSDGFDAARACVRYPPPGGLDDDFSPASNRSRRPRSGRPARARYRTARRPGQGPRGTVADLRRRPRRTPATRRSTRSTPATSATLEVAWRFKTDSLGPRPEYQFESTPLMVERRALLDRRHPPRRRRARRRHRRAAVDAQRARRRRAAQAAPRQLSGRGLAYWTDGARGADPLRHAGLPAGRARRQDRHPGLRASARRGVVDLKQNDDQEIDLVTGEIGLHATPIVAGNIVIIGAAHLSGGVPRSKTQRRRATCAASTCKTGKRLWIFHTIPRPGEFGNDTWLNDSWSYTGNTGVWAQISVDEELGLAYLPVEVPTGDYYGGHRPGQQPVRREHRRGRSEDRPAQVALPAGAPRHLGPRHPVRADPRRHHRQRPDRQGAGAADQAGVPLRPRSRDRRADLADRRAAGREGRRAGRVVRADAAVPARRPRQAVPVRPQRLLAATT